MHRKQELCAKKKTFIKLHLFYQALFLRLFIFMTNPERPSSISKYH